MVFRALLKLTLIASLCTVCLSGCSHLKAEHPSVDRATNQAIDYCIQWHASNVWSIDDPEASSRVKVINEGLCIDGEITPATFETVTTVLASRESDDPLVVVIRSPGGDVDVALDIAELFKEYNATVVASEFCASSCANYILPSVAKRYVLKDTLLMFHGGVVLDGLNDIAEQLHALHKMGHRIDPLKEIEYARRDLNKKILRQEEFLVSVGIDRHFFRWMDLFNHMDEERKRLLCPPGSSMIVFHPDILRNFGYRIDYYSGPLSQEQTNRIVEAMSVDSNVCFWGPF